MIVRCVRSVAVSLAVKRLPIVLFLVAPLAVAPAVGAADDRASQRRALNKNRTLWAQQHVRDYRFRLRVRCFCPEARRAVIVTVRDGRPRGAGGFQKRLDTVPELFSAIRRALDDSRAGEVAVRYDRRRGFPRTASIDRIRNAIDDEIGWTADHFRVLEAS
jgi:uncharacterized protein DUF6174